MSIEEGARPRTISRRTVAKAAAWGVPAALAVAAATPAYAVSGCQPTIDQQKSCKCPGNSTGLKFGYILTLCASGCGGVGSDSVTITGIINNANKDLVPCGTSYPLTIDAGQCLAEIKFTSQSSASSLIVSYKVGDSDTVQTVTLPAPPDCADGRCVDC